MPETSDFRPDASLRADPVHSLASSLPAWGAKLAFGEVVAVGGREVVPAALVIFGFGGGGGSGAWPGRAAAASREGAGEGSGGGGGGYVLPIGAYVSGPDGLKFRPNLVAMVIVAVPLVSAAGWAIARIVAATRAARPLD